MNRFHRELSDKVEDKVAKGVLGSNKVPLHRRVVERIVLSRIKILDECHGLRRPHDDTDSILVREKPCEEIPEVY